MKRQPKDEKKIFSNHILDKWLVSKIYIESSKLNKKKYRIFLSGQKIWIDTSLKKIHRASLVAQWLRIRLPTQGTQVHALVREDTTCRGATKPVRHNYWPHEPQLLKPTRQEPMLHKRATPMRRPHIATKSSPRSLQLEKAREQQQRPNTAKNK